MKKTIKISNGRLSWDSSGMLETVEGANKGAQDIARSLLTDYSSYFDDGSTLNRLNLVNGIAEVSVAQAIDDSIHRLISLQANYSYDDRILKIEKRLVQRVSADTIVFLVQALHSSGQAVEVAEQLTETKLEHLLDIAKVYK